MFTTIDGRAVPDTASILYLSQSLPSGPLAAGTGLFRRRWRQPRLLAHVVYITDQGADLLALESGLGSAHYAQNHYRTW